jgi:hypothetical protein
MGWLLKIGMTKFAMGIWDYTKGLYLLKDFKLESMDFFVASFGKHGAIII